jgi:hypothetical protein
VRHPGTDTPAFRLRIQWLLGHDFPFGPTASGTTDYPGSKHTASAGIGSAGIDWGSIEKEAIGGETNLWAGRAEWGEKEFLTGRGLPRKTTHKRYGLSSVTGGIAGEVTSYRMSILIFLWHPRILLNKMAGTALSFLRC